MLLLKLTFPMELKRFKSYMTSPHPVSEAQLEKKRKVSAFMKIIEFGCFHALLMVR
jgi:hypothetical protein